MIKLVNVHKSFKGQKILDGVNLHCPRGEITVLLGRSGSGKSVTLKHIIGLVNPDSGQVLIDDQDITKMDPFQKNEMRKKFGMLFQDGALFDSMTVEQNVMFPLKESRRYKKDEMKKMVTESLEEVGLFGIEQKMPSELSGGMRKRVALARAIVLSPLILLYDEPTTGLDPIMNDSITRLIRKTQELHNCTSFIISHDIESALRIAHHVAVLYKGGIVFSGTPEEIRKCEHPFVAAFISGTRGEEFEEIS